MTVNPAELEQHIMQLEVILETAQRRYWQPGPYKIEDALADLDDIARQADILINHAKG